MISGLFLSIGMTPFDVIATRLFNQGNCEHCIPKILFTKIFTFHAGVDKNGRGILYRNIFDCFIKTFKIEGVRGLYKGFAAMYCRCAPHTVFSLTIWDIFKEWKNIYLCSDEKSSAI